MLGLEFINGLPQFKHAGQQIFNMSALPGSYNFFDSRSVYVDPIMSDLAIEYSQSDMFIAPKIMPVKKVKKESGLWWVYDSKNRVTLPSNVIRADTDTTNLVNAGLSESSYTCLEYSLGMLIGRRAKENADQPVEPIQDAVQLLTELIMLNREIRTKDALFNATTFASYSETLSGSDQWSDYENSNPRTQAKTANESIRQNAMKLMNTCVIGSAVYDQLEDHPELQARIVGGSDLSKPALLDEKTVARMLKVNTLHVGRSVYNSANEGQTISNADVWGKNALFAFVNPTPPRKGMTLGVTLQTQNLTVALYDVPGRKSTMVEVSVIEVPKVVSAGAGYYVISVVV